VTAASPPPTRLAQAAEAAAVRLSGAQYMIAIAAAACLAQRWDADRLVREALTAVVEARRELRAIADYAVEHTRMGPRKRRKRRAEPCRAPQ
jgi:hypothetical protein